MKTALHKIQTMLEVFYLVLKYITDKVSNVRQKRSKQQYDAFNIKVTPENVLLGLAHIKNVRTDYFAMSHKLTVTINGQETQPVDLRQNKLVHCGQ